MSATGLLGDRKRDAGAKAGRWNNGKARSRQVRGADGGWRMKGSQEECRQEGKVVGGAEGGQSCPKRRECRFLSPSLSFPLLSIMHSREAAFDSN